MLSQSTGILLGFSYTSWCLEDHLSWHLIPFRSSKWSWKRSWSSQGTLTKVPKAWSRSFASMTCHSDMVTSKEEFRILKITNSSKNWIGPNLSKVDGKQHIFHSIQTRRNTPWKKRALIIDSFRSRMTTWNSHLSKRPRIHSWNGSEYYYNYKFKIN